MLERKWRNAKGANGNAKNAEGSAKAARSSILQPEGLTVSSRGLRRLCDDTPGKPAPFLPAPRRGATFLYPPGAAAHSGHTASAASPARA
jgi:hypothetical protein